MAFFGRSWLLGVARRHVFGSRRFSETPPCGFCQSIRPSLGPPLSSWTVHSWGFVKNTAHVTTTVCDHCFNAMCDRWSSVPSDTFGFCLPKGRWRWRVSLLCPTPLAERHKKHLNNTPGPHLCSSKCRDTARCITPPIPLRSCPPCTVCRSLGVIVAATKVLLGF